MKKQLLVLTLSIIAGSTFAQNFQWASGYGSTSTDMGNAITTDRNGNVYTIGTFDGTFDFDPGPSTFTMSSGTGQDIFISKLNSAGNFIWAKQFAGNSTNMGTSIAVDKSGNVYTTGNFLGTADFDPGIGTYTFAATAGTNDIFMSKLDVSGNFVWAKQMVGAIGAEDSRSIVLDNYDNLLITGVIQQGACDFDPSPTGTYTLTAVNGYDIFVGKYTNNGDLIWVKQLGGSGQFEYGFSVAVDGSGNVYSTGYFQSTGDFDPGAGVYNLTASGTTQDAYISKLDASGNFVWAKQLDGTGSEDSRSIAVDASGNVYSTGRFDGVLDMDPSASTYTLNTFGSSDIFVSKLDVSGNFVWGKQLGGSGFDFAYSIAVDACGNVYTTGFFNVTADFDPSPSTSYTITSAGSYDIFISKLDPIGNFVSVKQMGNTSVEGGNGITVDANGSIYTTGWFSNTVDFDPGAGTSNLVSAGGYDFFIQKLVSGSFIPTQPTSISGSTSVCAGSTNTYSVALVSGASSYSWALPGGCAGSSTSNTISITVGNSSDVISVFAVNGCASSFAQNVTITVNAKPVIAINSGTLCSGSSYTLTPSGASTYTYSSGTAIVSPTTTTSYSIAGTSSVGCVSSSPAVSNVTVIARPVISVNSGSICSGNTFTIIPNGASTYTYSGGSATVSPTTTTSYSVTGTNTAGCVSSIAAVSTVTVKPKPVIYVNSGSICSGNSFTITPTGASTYTYSGGSATVSPTTTTSYSVTGTNTAGCVSNVAAVSSITVNQLPIINTTANNTIVCSGQTVTLGANGAVTYTWVPGNQSGFLVNVTPTVTTNYTVTGTGSNGCTNTMTQSVSVNALPLIIANTSNTLLCVGQTATINVTGANTYTWSTSENGSSISVSPTVNTTYTINGTDANNCNGSVTFTQNVSACTGLDLLSNSSLSILNVYPNPNNGNFTITSSEDMILSVTDNLGQITQVINLNTFNHHQENINVLSSGIYFIVGQSLHQSINQKIIVTQ
jgi:hypothetical protein